MFFFVARFATSGLKHGNLGFEIDLARDRRFGEILAILFKCEFGFSLKLLEFRGDHLNLTERLRLSGRRPSCLSPRIVERPIDFPNGFAHHALASGLLHGIDEIFDPA
ncbi:hypothetical protein M2322_003959 [Rhodoblastus acidophilus]|nr:hypothetical protein [Rhodoblastus acidophilus]